MSGGQFWLTVALVGASLVIAYLVGVADGSRATEARLDRARRDE